MSDDIYMFVLKIFWVRRRSVILILSSYLVVIFAGFWKALCIWEFGIDNKIVCCVYGMVHCVYICTPHPFGSELIYLHMCTLLQFLGNSLPFFIFCGWKKVWKNPSHTNNTAVLYLGCFFSHTFAFLCAIDTNKIVWSIVAHFRQIRKNKMVVNF